MALFYVNKESDLIPIAIQLFQEPAEDNPVCFDKISIQNKKTRQKF